MNPIVINGTVLCDNITGIPRYVYETVVRLDKLIEGTGLDVRIAYRDDGRPIHLPELKNIRLVPLKAVKYFYNLAVLPAYLRRTHAFYVGLASDMLLTRRSVVVLHDIRPLVMDTDKGPFFRFKFWVHCLSTKWFAQRVFTVSDNQRHLISEKLGIPLDKIGITYNGWEHMKGVTPDESIFEKMPGVQKGEYYYALGSLAKHKNFKWIREVARRNPDKTFVVAGGKDLRAFGDDTEAKDTHNVFYPGYVSDAENAALMKHCKLFLHPAVFEGFGIPPLEALALGAPIALANATCLPELYGDTARYFDPYDYDTDLDRLAAQPVAAPDEVLQKYSWDRTANFWLHEIEKVRETVIKSLPPGGKPYSHRKEPTAPHVFPDNDLPHGAGLRAVRAFARKASATQRHKAGHRLGRRPMAGHLAVRGLCLPPPRADRRLQCVPSRGRHSAERLDRFRHRRAAQLWPQGAESRCSAVARHGAGVGSIRRQRCLLQHSQL